MESPQKITACRLPAYTLLLLFTLFLISAASAHVPLQVEWKAERLSVNAEQVPLAQILQEIARQTGIEIRGLEGVQEPFSVHFVGLPLDEGLEKLVVNYVVVWKTIPQQGRRPVLALVSGPKMNSPSPPQSYQAILHGEEPEQEEEIEGEDEQSKHIIALHTLAKQRNMEALRKALLDPDPAIQATALTLLAEQDQQGTTPLLLDAIKSDRPERRLQALQLLYQVDQTDSEAVLLTLSQALIDEDSTVKGYAIQALADRGGTDALGYLRQAFNDPDPTVRMLVVEHAALRDQTFPLLREALSDKDEGVRSLASSLLADHR